MDEVFYKNLKYLREKKNMTQQQLADRLDIDRSTISKWEHLQMDATLKYVLKIAEILEVDINNLLYSNIGENNMNKKEKSDRQKTKDEILEQLYVSASDLQVWIPYLPYATALEYIKSARDEMAEKNIFVPTGKTKIALTKIIRKNFGF